jgi:hypothetical protein
MKSSKIFRYLKKVLNKEDAQKKDALNDILSKLKKKERKIKGKLEDSTDEAERAVLLEKLKVNEAHRKKGIDALRKLNGKS